jgi:protein TonB
MERGAIVSVIVGVVTLLTTVSGATHQQGQPLVDGQVLEPGNGVSMPSVIKQVDPEYTDAARAAKIQGVVTLKGVIEPDGHTDNIVVIKSLDKQDGLDDEAVKAAQQWLFEPCKKDGKAVRCNVQIELEFRLDRRR